MAEPELVELDEWLAADIGEAEPSEALPIEDDLLADRYLRRLALIEAEKQRVEGHVGLEVERMKEWGRRRLEKVEREKRYVEDLLEGFMRGRHAAGGPRTLELPNGTLVLRKPVGRVDVRDPVEFLRWAGTHPEFLNPPPPIPEPTPNKRVLAALKRSGSSRRAGEWFEHDVVLDGELVPGVLWIEPVAPKFEAKAADLP